MRIPSSLFPGTPRVAGTSARSRVRPFIRAFLAFAAACAAACAIVACVSPGSAPRASLVEPGYGAPRASVAPAIDGDPRDAAWEAAAWAPINQLWWGSAQSSSVYEGSYKAVWTPERLYVLFRIKRDEIHDDYGDEQHPWEFDCAEIFIDEDHSGGDHQKNFNAFSYHMTTGGHVWDWGNGGRRWERFDEDVKLVVKHDEDGFWYWETELKIFGPEYRYGGTANAPKVLAAGKKMGFAAAYNTSAGGKRRNAMYGSHYLSGDDKNTCWREASDFGDMTLVE